MLDLDEDDCKCSDYSECWLLFNIYLSQKEGYVCFLLVIHENAVYKKKFHDNKKRTFESREIFYEIDMKNNK